MTLKEEDVLNESSEEVKEIIEAVPSWLLTRGISIILLFISFAIALSAFIEYPEIVKTGLKVNSLNAPKSILAKQNGKLVRLLVKEQQMVEAGQPLAYFESTANPNDVLTLNKMLKIALRDYERTGEIQLSLPLNYQLGELQVSFQSFHQEYLKYLSVQKDGFLVNRINFLSKEIKNIQSTKNEIIKQKNIQEQEYANSEKEYIAYKKLYEQKVISRSEFIQQENKYLAAKYPLQQTEMAILNNSTNYWTKEKELGELKNSIVEQKANFLQAANQFVSVAEAWIKDYILIAPERGNVIFAGILQPNQNVSANDEVFIIKPKASHFFGEIKIPQYNMGRVRIGDRVLVKMKSFPFEQYGVIRGTLSYVSEVPYRDSVFIAKVNFEKFENKDPYRKITLKNGMQADVEIITEDITLLQRFVRNITKILREH